MNVIPLATLEIINSIYEYGTSLYDERILDEIANPFNKTYKTERA